MNLGGILHRPKLYAELLVGISTKEWLVIVKTR
jgi:hypothetical protein